MTSILDGLRATRKRSPLASGTKQLGAIGLAASRLFHFGLLLLPAVLLFGACPLDHAGSMIPFLKAALSS